MRLALLAVLAVAGAARAQFERMAALHETVVSAHSAGGDVGLFTYDHDPGAWLDNLAFGKLRAGVRAGDQTLWLADAVDRTVRNSPGGEGVEARGTLHGREVLLEALPTAAGRDTAAWEGSALFKLSCPGQAPVIRFGSVGRVRIHGFRPEKTFRPEYLLKPDVLPPEAAANEVTVAGDVATIATPGLPTVVVRCSAPLASDGIWLTASAPAGPLWLHVAFAASADRARELVDREPTAVERECRERFAALVAASSIETPDPALNDAYRAALVNLEYTWRRPYGWIESVHHWGTFWTMQHTLAADWIGQADRSKECLLAHAERLMPSGQVPDLDPSGRARVDFGGWNQFWCWSVGHLWGQSGDRDFLERVDGPLKRVVEQTFAAHDPDGNGLLGFGQQIGNQEDYITTPCDGTSPTIAGLEMLRLRAEVALELGRLDEAAELEAQAARVLAALRRELYRPDLGRFIFYRDPLGVEHLEGQYHTYIWPVIFGVLDGPEAYLSMMHVADTLTGDEGQIYCSNNFPRHVRATVGSQDGAQQQPWATLGWAAVGDAERAVKPLQWIARWVTNEVNQGSWPEVAESHPSYFSPPAGVFVSATIEGLFGLKMDRPNNRLTVSPCLPAEWKRARIVTPEVVMTVTQEERRRVIRVRCAEPRSIYLNTMLPSAMMLTLTANGRAYPRPPFGAVDRSSTWWESAEPIREATLVLTWEPIGDRVRVSSRYGRLTVETQDIAQGALLDPRNAMQLAPIDLGTRRILISAAPAGELSRDYGAAGRRCAGDVRLFQHLGLFALEVPPQWLPINASELLERPGAQPWRGIVTRSGTDWRLAVYNDQTTADQELNLGRLRLGPIERLGPRRRMPGSRAIDRTNQPPLDVALRAPDLARLGPGRTEYAVGEDDVELRGAVDLSPIFSADPALRALALARCRPVPLPEETLLDDDGWRSWRFWSALGHQPWASLRPPLEGLEADPIEPPAAPGLRFANPRGKLAVVSRHLDRPSVRIPLSGRASRVYLLVVPLLDNVNVYAPVADVTVKCGDGTYFRRRLHFPGDLDWWGPKHILGDFATVDTDWCDSLRFEAPQAVMNILEVDLGGWRPVESVTVEAVGAYPCLGLAGVTLFGSPDPGVELPEGARAYLRYLPVQVFGFDQPSLDGWEIEGTAWGIGDPATDPWQRRGASRWFADSLAHGEPATGVLRSPPFEVTGGRLEFTANGHGAGCWFALADAATGQELRRAGAPGATGAFGTVTWDVAELRGRRVRFVATDAETAPAYAWIAFDALVMLP